MSLEGRVSQKSIPLGRTGDSTKMSNIWRLNDYNWTHENLAYSTYTNEMEYKVQYAEVTEFQPTEIWDFDKVQKKLKNVAYGAANKATGGLLQKYYIESKIDDFVKKPETQSSVLQEYGKWLDKLYNPRYVARYYFPYFGEDLISVDNHAGWDNKGSYGDNFADTSAFKGITAAIEVFGQSEMTFNNYPMRLTYKPSEETGPPLKISYTLINNSMDAIQSNFRLIHALEAGMHQVNIDGAVKCANLYRVYIPEERLIYYASASMGVKKKGKQRRLGKSVAKEIGVKYLDGNSFIPDAYEVEITFKSIVPENFNVQMAMLEGGFDGVQYEEGESMEELGSMSADIEAALMKADGMIKSGVDKAKSLMSDAPKAFSDGLDNLGALANVLKK